MNFDEFRKDEEKLFTMTRAVLGLIDKLDFVKACQVICMAVDDTAVKYDFSTDELLELLSDQIRNVNREIGRMQSRIGNTVNVTIKGGD